VVDVDSLPAFLVVEEAAALARAPVGSVRSWCERGLIESHRAGRRRLIPRDAFVAWLRGEAPPT